MPELQRDHRTVPQPLGAATLSGWALFGVSAADAVLAAVGAYHESEPAKLIERVREGLVRYDAGEIDAFELDDLVHHYKRATQKLWSFRVGSGGHVLTVARTLEWLREQDELPDRWEQATPRRSRG